MKWGSIVYGAFPVSVTRCAGVEMEPKSLMLFFAFSLLLEELEVFHCRIWRVMYFQLRSGNMATLHICIRHVLGSILG